LAQDQALLEPIKKARVQGFDGEGRYGSIDAEEAEDAIPRGLFRLATPDEIKKKTDEKVYQERPLGAGALSAARAASFGLSDQALTKTGLISPETLAGLEEYNPGASLAGEIAGVAGSMMVPGPNLIKGVNLLGKGAYNLTKPLTKPAAKAVADLISHPGTAKFVDAALTKVPAAIVGGIVEGTFYATGRLVTEEALGHPEMTGEEILSYVGGTELLTGAMTGAFKLGGVALPYAAKAAKTVKENLLKNVAKISSFLSNKSLEDIEFVIPRRAKTLVNASKQEDLVRKTMQETDSLINHIDDLEKKAFQEIRPLENKELLQNINRKSARNFAMAQFQKAVDLVNEMIEHSALYNATSENIPHAAAQLKALINEFTGEMSKAKSALDVYNVLTGFRRAVDDRIVFDTIITGPQKLAQAKLRGLRIELKNALTNEEVWGNAGARTGAFNEAYNEFRTAAKEFRKLFTYKKSTKTGHLEFELNPEAFKNYLGQSGKLRGIRKEDALEDFFESAQNFIDQFELSNEWAHNQKTLFSSKFDKEIGKELISKATNLSEELLEQGALNRATNNLLSGKHNVPIAEAVNLGTIAVNPLLGSLIYATNTLSDPGQQLRRLAKLEAFLNRTRHEINAKTKALFKEGLKEPAAAYLASKLAHEEKVEKSQKLFKKFNQYVADPGYLVDVLTENTEVIRDVAPNITQAMQVTTSRGVLFLQSKIPQEGERRLLSRPLDPSPAELAKFGRYQQIVEDPVSVLSELKNGTLTVEHMEALLSVYPTLYGQMKESVLNDFVNQSEEERDSIPHSLKVSLSLFLGEDLVSTLSAESISANQQTLMGPSQQQEKQDQMSAENQGRKKATGQKGLDKLNLSQEIKTPMQKAESR
jgi:hypothetical protein